MYVSTLEVFERSKEQLALVKSKTKVEIRRRIVGQ